MNICYCLIFTCFSILLIPFMGKKQYTRILYFSIENFLSKNLQWEILVSHHEVWKSWLVCKQKHYKSMLLFWIGYSCTLAWWHARSNYTSPHVVWTSYVCNWDHCSGMRWIPSKCKQYKFFKTNLLKMLQVLIILEKKFCYWQMKNINIDRIITFMTFFVVHSLCQVGDLLNFLSAIFFGIHMLRTEHISRSTKRENFLALTGYEVRKLLHVYEQHSLFIPHLFLRKVFEI